MRLTTIFIFLTLLCVGQPCPDDLNHTNSSVNTVVAYIYENGVLVDSIECNLAGGSGNINCDLGTVNSGYISLGEPYEDCIYDTDGNLDPTLPVGLDYFEVVKSDGVVIARWATHTEVDNNYFILEGSYSGKSWRVLKKVGGMGSSYTLVEYKSELPKYRYYRLSQFDYNGESERLGVRYLHGDLNPIIIKTVNLMGQEVDESYRGVVVDVFSDNTTRKRFQQ